MLAIFVFIVVFILGLAAVGFLVVNALTLVLALFGVIIPVFGFIEYLAVGFLLTYIRGYIKQSYFADLIKINRKE